MVRRIPKNQAELSMKFHKKRSCHSFRKRKLLLHKKEILKLRAKTQEQGLGIVPLKLYFKDDKVKVEIAIVRGKKLYDKRATEAKKSAEREIHRVLREREKR